MSVSYMRPSGTRNHVQTGFHRVSPCMQFCLHGLSPILDRSSDLAQTSAHSPSRAPHTLPNPAWESTRPVQPFGMRPKGARHREPRPPLLLLLGVGVGHQRGLGQRGRVRETWAARNLILFHVGVGLEAFPKWETMEAQFPIYRIAYKVF